MSCFHPKKGYLQWLPNENKYRVWFNVENSEKFAQFMSGVPGRSLPYVPTQFDRSVQMPCGECIGCLDDYAKDWAKRVQLEALYYPGRVWFVTLTYSDEFLMSIPERVGYFCAGDPKTGEVFDDDCFMNIAQLYKPDLIEFVNRCRYCPPYSPGLKFFCSGEYGPKTLRPHFHVILFNLNLPRFRPDSHTELEDGYFDPLSVYKDLIPYSPGSPYFISRHIAKLWPYGGHTIFPYSYSTGKYVAKYLVKDYQSSAAAVGKIIDGRTKPFLHMSRRPGIGGRFFNEHKESLKELGTVILNSENGAFATSLPKYFDRLIRGKEHVDERFVEWFEYKNRNYLRGECYADSVLRRSGLSLDSYLSRSEEVAVANAKAKKYLL